MSRPRHEMVAQAAVMDTSPVPDLAPSTATRESWQHRTRRRGGRPCKYPYAAVEYTRRLRRFGFSYGEIIDELEYKFGFRVSKASVRDWSKHYWRMLG